MYHGRGARLSDSEMWNDTPLRTKLYGASIIAMILGVIAFGYGLIDGLSSAWVLTYDETSGKVFQQQRWSANTGFGGSGNDRRYYLKVLYSFNVEAREFVGWRINPGLREWKDDSGRPCHSFGSSQARDEVANKYRKGTKVTVHYNSSDPSESVIESSLADGGLLALFGGPLLFILGFGYFRHLKGTEHLVEEDERRLKRRQISAD